MAVRIIKKSWWVDFRFNHRRYRKRSPENTKAGAEAYEAFLKRKLALGESIDALMPQEELTFEQFAQKWFEDYVIPNNKHSEQRSKKYVLSSSLIPFFGRFPVGGITTHHVELYKAQEIRRSITNKTLKNRLTVLNKCLVTAYEWQLRSAPPKINWPKCTSYRTDYLSAEECDLLVSHADGVVREMIIMALRTGMRQGELKGLQWSSIDWENRSVAVRHSRDDRMKLLLPPKNNHERHIPLDIEIFEMLYRRKQKTGYVFLDTDSEPFDYHRMERRLTKVCNAAGLRKIGWHTLRHTFASQLAMHSPLHVVKELMGHSNIATTMRYTHLAPSALREAIDRLNPKTRLQADFGQPVGNRSIRAQRAEIT